MGENHEQAKRLLRDRLRALRVRLPSGEVCRRSSTIAARVADLPAFAAARHVVVYAATDNEVDPSSLVATAAAAGKAVYFPRMTDGGLEFVQAEPAALRPGWRGVPEPPAGRPLPSRTDDVLFLVPGVGFDPRGARLGRGAGCYDRALALHPTATRIGLAYEFQVVPHLPESAWDVRLHAVVTETRVLDCGSGSIGQ
jgi:5-formyltetrahydrofolate cyclo-ligase